MRSVEPGQQQKAADALGLEVVELATLEIAVDHLADGVVAGVHVARAEVTITLEEWLKRIPEFEPAAGYKPCFHSGVVCSLESLPLKWKV